MDQLCRTSIIREMENDKEMGSEFINPITILQNGNTIKLVIDAHYLNSIIDLSRYSWPLKAIGSRLIKLKGNYFTTSDLCSANNQDPAPRRQNKELVLQLVQNKTLLKEVSTASVVFLTSLAE